MGIGIRTEKRASGFVLKGIDVKAKIALFDASFSTLVSVEESTKEIEDCDDHLFTWISSSPKSVRFDDDGQILHMIAPAERHEDLWYSQEDYNDFEDEMGHDATCIRINLPRAVKRGSELYRLCTKAGGDDNAFTRSHRQKLTSLYRSIDDFVGLERLLLEEESRYERNIAILSLLEEFGCNGGRNHDDAICALASLTISLPSRRRARELAVAQAATTFEGKEMLSI
eukprot:CAMPEP_0198142734 /NCGR_PEP_ID=MMETSP1443-20131203/5451_1 /TAXON_ID=186043 /ORGANISM="Entomoneis sp., Strain CCMP2396" /LENGTH=226 /DNA_ID=CAMNT_0043805817 /DNA_START=120 /DNA_END=800 /DNA_ORIENTATION=-